MLTSVIIHYLIIELIYFVFFIQLYKKQIIIILYKLLTTISLILIINII